MSLEAPPDLEFGTFRIDREQRLLFSGTEIVPLAPKTFDTLLALVEGQGRIVEKDALLKRVWPDTFVEEGSLTRNVSILRKTLGRGVDDQTYIETVPKRGYRFVAAVRPVTRIPLEPGPPAPDVVHVRESTPRRWLLVAVVTAGVVVAGWSGWLWSRATNPLPSGVMRLGFTLPATEPFEVYNGSPISSVAIASDGSFVIYGAVSTATGKSHLYSQRTRSIRSATRAGLRGRFKSVHRPRRQRHWLLQKRHAEESREVRRAVRTACHSSRRERRRMAGRRYNHFRRGSWPGSRFEQGWNAAGGDDRGRGSGRGAPSVAASSAGRQRSAVHGANRVLAGR